MEKKKMLSRISKKAIEKPRKNSIQESARGLQQRPKGTICIRRTSVVLAYIVFVCLFVCFVSSEYNYIRREGEARTRMIGGDDGEECAETRIPCKRYCTLLRGEARRQPQNKRNVSPVCMLGWPE